MSPISESKTLHGDLTFKSSWQASTPNVKDGLLGGHLGSQVGGGWRPSSLFIGCGSYTEENGRGTEERTFTEGTD